MQKCTNVVENPLSLSPFINLLFACITHSIFETSCVLVVLIMRKNCGVCVETENVRQNTTEIVIKKSLHHKRKLLINFHLLWFLFPLYRCCYYE